MSGDVDVAALKGPALADALAQYGLDGTGTAQEKRARIAEHLAKPADPVDPVEPAEAVDQEPVEVVAADGEELYVVLRHITGYRNGVPWPAVGERISLPPGEAEDYLKSYVVAKPLSEQ